MSAFENTHTPEEWCKKLRKTGASVSARALRTKARELGEFYSLGRTMLLSEEHVQTLLSADAEDSKRRNIG